jgi:hypothetical protein
MVGVEYRDNLLYFIINSIVIGIREPDEIGVFTYEN